LVLQYLDIGTTMLRKMGKWVKWTRQPGVDSGKGTYWNCYKQKFFLFL